jgi:hypothetical protein
MPTGRVGKDIGPAPATPARPGTRTPGARAEKMLKTSQEGNWKADRMVKDPTATPRSAKRKGGRPARAVASARALRGVDVAAIDPIRVLQEIAADRSAPALARMGAAKALLALPDGSEVRTAAEDTVAARAIRLLAARRAH